MSKKDLAHVLVKLSGFSWMLWSIFSGIAHLIGSIPFVGSGSIASSVMRWTLLAGLLTMLIQVVLALTIIKKAEVIVRWLFGHDET